MAVPSGLRGRPRPPRLLSSPSLRLRLSWPGSAPSPEREGGRGGDGRARRAWGPRNTTRDLQRAAPSCKRVLRIASLGSPDCPKQSPLFRTGQGPPDQSLDWMKARKCPTITRTNRAWRGLRTVLGQSGFRNPGPQRWVPQPQGGGNSLSILGGALGAPDSNTRNLLTGGRVCARLLPRQCPKN